MTKIDEHLLALNTILAATCRVLGPETTRKIRETTASYAPDKNIYPNAASRIQAFDSVLHDLYSTDPALIKERLRISAGEI
jgi:hypothetical protein